MRRTAAAIVGIGLLAAACSSSGGGAKASSSPSAATTSPAVTASPTPAVPTITLHLVGKPMPSGTRTIRLPGIDATTVTGIASLAADAGVVWTSGPLYRIRASTARASGPFAAATPAGDLGVGASGVWASDGDNDRIRRYDSSGRLVATVALPADSLPESVVVLPGGVWVTMHHGGVVDRIDPRTNRVVARVSVATPGSDGPQGLASGLGSLWVGVPRDANVYRVGIASQKVTASISTGDVEPCGGLAIGPTAAWVSQCLDGTDVAQIDPRTNKLAAVIDTGGEVATLAADGDSVWFVTSGDPDSSPDKPSYLVQLSKGGRVLHSFRLPTGFTTGGVVLTRGTVWLSSSSKTYLLRVPVPR